MTDHNPEADHRLLLQAITDAAARGTSSHTEPLMAAIANERQDRQRWAAEIRAATTLTREAGDHLAKTSRHWVYDSIGHLAIFTAVAIALMFAAVLAYDLAKQPKIENHFYHCVGKWNAKKQTCKGEWVLVSESTNR